MALKIKGCLHIEYKEEHRTESEQETTLLQFLTNIYVIAKMEMWSKIL